MKSLADGLPAEIAQQIHPEWRKNEAEYWAVRDELVAQYRDQWIGFADGAVVASGRSPVEVFHAAHRAAQHPFFICVGREDEPSRIRRSTRQSLRLSGLPQSLKVAPSAGAGSVPTAVRLSNRTREIGEFLAVLERGYVHGADGTSSTILSHSVPSRSLIVSNQIGCEAFFLDPFIL